MNAAIGHNTHRIVREARRRLLVAAIVESAGRGLAWGAVVGFGAVAVSRIVNIPVETWMLIGAPLLAGAAIGMGLALTRRKSSLGAASVVDQRLGLKDRIATATSIESMVRGDGVFADLAIAEAEAASSAADVRRAVPVRFGNAWVVWPAALATAVVAAVYVPRFDLLGRKSEVAKANEIARERVEAQLATAGKKAEPKADPEIQRVDSKAQTESERVLDEVRKELAAGTTTPQAAAERAAKQLDTLAKDREQVAAASEQRRESVEQAVGELRKSDADGAGKDQSDLAKALRSGDFAQASQAAKDLLNSEKASGAKDRARAAEEIAKIAEQLRAAAKATEDAKRRSEQSRPASPQTDQEQTQPSAASDPSAAQERKDQSPPDRSTEDLAKSLERAAEALRNESPKQERQSPQDSKPESAKPSPNSDTSKDEAQPKAPPSKPQQPDSLSQSDSNKQTDSQSKPESQPQQGEQREPKGPQAKKQQGTEQSQQSESSPTKSQKQTQPREQRQSGEPNASQPQKQPESQESGESDPEKQPDSANAQPKPDQKSETAKPDEKPQTSKSDQIKPDQKSEKQDSSKRPSEPKQSDSKPKEHDAERKGENDNPGGSSSPATPGPDSKPSPSAPPSSTPDDQLATPRPDPTKPSEKSDNQQSPSSSERSGAKGSEKQSQPKPGDATDPKQGESAADESPPPNPDGSKPGFASKPSPSQQDPSHPDQSKQDPTKPPQPNDETTKPDPSAPNKLPGKIPAPSREDIKRLADELQNLADSPKDAAARRQEAQQYRKQAEELLKNASPEQREQIKRWGQDLADEMKKRGHGESESSPSTHPNGRGPGNKAGDSIARTPEQPRVGRTNIVDARSRPSPDAGKPRERVIAEWYADRPVDPADRSTSTTAPTGISSEGQNLAREAAREGERALESQIIPGRFDKLLQRYFQRLPQRAGAKPDGGTPAGSKPVEPAKDAPTSGAASP
jgi:hypothetical protein